jgi:hypothetical protein
MPYHRYPGSSKCASIPNSQDCAGERAWASVVAGSIRYQALTDSSPQSFPSCLRLLTCLPVIQYYLKGLNHGLDRLTSLLSLRVLNKIQLGIRWSPRWLTDA